MSIRKEEVSSSQMVVDRKYFGALRSMEFRHLGYVRAAEYMGLLQHRHAEHYRKHSEKSRQEDNRLASTAASYELGYLDAIKTMGEVQLRMVQQVLDSHPGHDVQPGPFRKGQFCLVDRAGCYCLVVARENE